VCLLLTYSYPITAEINNLSSTFHHHHHHQPTTVHCWIWASPISHQPSHSILGYSHPAAASRPAQIVPPPGLRASQGMFTKTLSPLQNSFTSAVIGSTADMASPPPQDNKFLAKRLVFFKTGTQKYCSKLLFSTGRFLVLLVKHKFGLILRRQMGKNGLRLIINFGRK
jgi:hypothetical protein